MGGERDDSSVTQPRQNRSTVEGGESPTRVVLPILKRLGWGFSDQALSSLTNFAISFLVVRSVGLADFGAFSLAFATYAVGLNVIRAVASQPLVVRYSGPVGPRWRGGVAGATGATLIIGFVGAIGCLGVGLVGHGAFQQAFVALAITTPGLLLQDSWRFAFFACGQGVKAFVNDAIWAVLLFPALWLVLHLGGRSVFWLVLVWGAAASVAAVAGIAQSRIWPDPRRTRAWLGEHRDLWPRFLGEFTASTGLGQVTIYALGAISGLAAVGAIAAGRLALGPLNILFQGVGLVAVPEAVAFLNISATRLRQASIALGLTTAVAALAWGGLLLLVPTRLGLDIMGTSWVAARPFILPLTLVLGGAGLTIGAWMSLRGLAAAARSLKATTATSLLTAGAGVAGAALAGASGYAWGQASTTWVGAGIWWQQADAGLLEYSAAATREASQAGTPVLPKEPS